MIMEHKNEQIVEEAYESFAEARDAGKYDRMSLILEKLKDDGFTLEAETLAEMLTGEERMKIGWDCAYDEVNGER